MYVIESKTMALKVCSMRVWLARRNYYLTSVKINKRLMRIWIY